MHIAAGRSAQELIYTWTPGNGLPTVPEELQSLLDCHDLTADTTLTDGFAECETGLPPDTRHGPRNHDLLLFGAGPNGKIVVGVEAKADEPFDGTLNQKLQQKSVINNVRTGLPGRIDWLLREVFNSRFDVDGFRLLVNQRLHRPVKWDFSELFSDGQQAAPELARLRYQLFAGVAGTILEAADVNASTAVFVVHEFRTSKTDDKKLDRNAADFESFCQRFRGLKTTAISPGKLYGPIKFPNSVESFKKLPSVQLLIGKVRVNLRDD